MSTHTPLIPLERIQRLLRKEVTREVSRATGLHYNTVRNVRDGVQCNPTMRVMEALSQYFADQDAAHDL